MGWINCPCKTLVSFLHELLHNFYDELLVAAITCFVINFGAISTNIAGNIQDGTITKAFCCRL